MKKTTSYMLGLLSLAVVACAPEAQMTFEPLPSYPEAENLVESVEGRWQMNSVTTGQCPEGFGQPPFVGHTRWIGDGSKVTISSDLNVAPELEVTAFGARTLGRKITVDVEGCKFTEDINVVVDELTNRYASGFYSAIYVRGDSAECDVLAAIYDVPSQCEVTSEWQALRTSKNP